jgi:outer membrane receptor for Fe3+-dicitrate
MTDETGTYLISNAPEKAKLLFSYIGYQSQTIAINGRTQINVVLKLELQQLDEMVVIGYGTSSKRKNTGSVGSITSKEIAKQPVSNVLAALPGRISGTQVAQNNGLPAVPYKFR